MPPPPTAAAASGAASPKRRPERPLSERNTSTVSAMPARMAATAWPTMAHGATPPGPTSPQ